MSILLLFVFIGVGTSDVFPYIAERVVALIVIYVSVRTLDTLKIHFSYYCS